MGGDHKCPVCGSTFTRSQHVARHMRSHTGDRPYKCVHCGDQFARSDLLSRHVNKCHTNEKKNQNGPQGAGNARKKGRQPSMSGPVDAPPIVPPNPLFNDVLNPYQHHINMSNDPFSSSRLPSAPLYAQSPINPLHNNARRYSLAQSVEGLDPPSLSSSSLASTSSTSASLDSLPHEPVFHVSPTHQYVSSQALSSALHGLNDVNRQWHLPPHPHQPPPNQTHYNGYTFDDPRSAQDPSTRFKPDQMFNPGYPNQTAYNDLPTPLAYPSMSYGLSRPSGMDPFIPSNPADLPNAQSQLGNQPQPPFDNQQTQRFVDGTHRGEGGFSSAFGLMSLDDAAVLAGMAQDGVPFFENAVGMQSGAIHSSDAQTPNTREREINALREMWASFLKDPTTGLRPDGTEMPRPEFPVPATAGGGVAPTSGHHPSVHLHRRSSSYGGTTKNMGLSSVLRSPPIPHMPTAQQTLQGGANVVQKLEEKASGIPSQAQETNIHPQTHVAQAGQGENLRSYEEAILARKAPVLKLPAKLKSKDSSSSAGSNGSLSTTGGSLLPSLNSISILPPLPSSAGSSILPSIASSRSGTTTLGGSVGSLFQNQQSLPTAAGASGVPLGSTPLHAHLSGQYHPLTQQALAQQQASIVDRPMIAMPRPRSRSRPSTANGGAPTRPTSAVASTGPNGASQGGAFAGSQPSSRPGTASSNGGAGFAATHASPPQMQAHSQPNSRPSTSHAHYVGHSAVSPSHTFAYMPPPPNHAAQTFQPGSLPNESSMAAAMAAAGGSANGPIVVPESPVTGNRPSYKRLASQVLEPSSTKRPHIRRGDTNFNPTVASPGRNNENNMDEDGFESEGSVGGSERSFGHYQRHPRQYPLGMKSPTSANMPPMSGSGYPGHGYISPGLGMMSPAGMRRMSEPAVAAPRMAMRLPPPSAQVSVGPSGGGGNTPLI